MNTHDVHEYVDFADNHDFREYQICFWRNKIKLAAAAPPLNINKWTPSTHYLYYNITIFM